MFSWIRRRATYANVVLTVALVFAMSGGAYAAKKYLITSTKQISPSVLKSLQGKTGKAGAIGAEGKAGAPGVAGKDGLTGANGKDGFPGAEGKEGKQGIEGKAGREGKAGSPWTAGGTLPAKATETGAWSVGELPEGTFSEAPIFLPLSFAVPLSGPLDENHVHYIKEAETAPAGCTGGTAAAPTAEPGNLCVYEAENVFALLKFYRIFKAGAAIGEVGASQTGALLVIRGEVGGEGWGTWAVTGEEE